MKKIALSIGEMEHLKILGVDISGASMCWINEEHLVDCRNTVEQVFVNSNISFKNENKYTPAFILQDILELLPQEINWEKDKEVLNRQRVYDKDWDIIAQLSISLKPAMISFDVYGYEGLEFCIPYKLVRKTRIEGRGDPVQIMEVAPITGDNILDVAYKTLCWCAENGYLKPNKTE